MADVSIVIVEYMCIEDTIKALESAEQHLTDVNWEAIVVSNSEYETEEIDSFCKTLQHTRARVIRNHCNGGYAGGVNRAISEISSPFIFLLNPDGRFEDSNLHLLVQKMQKQPKLAVIGPKVINETRETQPSCRRFPLPYTFLLVRSFLRRLPNTSKEKARYLMEDYDRKQAQKVDWVSGGAMLLRTEIVNEVGLMDERYFLYMEDVDWCRTFWDKGWQVLYDPRMVVLHAGKHSSIGNGILAMFNQTTRWHLTSMWKYFCKWGFGFNE